MNHQNGHVCPECGKSFKNAAGLGSHRRRSHGIAGRRRALGWPRDEVLGEGSVVGAMPEESRWTVTSVAIENDDQSLESYPSVPHQPTLVQLAQTVEDARWALSDAIHQLRVALDHVESRDLD